MDKPTASPVSSMTVTVQEIAWLMRTYVVLALAWPIHDNVDETVGDETLNWKGPPRMGSAPMSSVI